MNEIRVHIPALYVDEIRASDDAAEIQVINRIPESAETAVPTGAALNLHVVCTTGIAVDISTVRIWVTRHSTGAMELAYHGGLGGFQPGFTGTEATRPSVGSAVLDEVIFTIIPAEPFISLEIIDIQVEASPLGGSPTSVMYTFTCADETSPRIVEVRWLSPTRVLVGFDEALTVQSIAYLYAGSGIEIASGVIVLRGQILSGSYWSSMWVGVRGSDRVANNQDWSISALSAVAASRLVSVTPAGVTLGDDNGRDVDPQGPVLRDRLVRGAMSFFKIETRLDEETGDLAEDSVHVGHAPLIKTISLLEDASLPPGVVSGSYIQLDLDEDISFGRLYKIRVYVGDAAGNYGEDTYDFRAPTFGLNLVTVFAPAAGVDRAADIGFWSDGFVPPEDRQEDLTLGEGILRKLSMVHQDSLNSLRYRAQQIELMHDPWSCPDDAAEFLLAHLGNPFRFCFASMLLMRRTAAFLVDLYKQTGTEIGIEKFIRNVLQIDVDVVPFVSTAGWVLDDPVWSVLGHTTTLWPGSSYQKNCYEIVSQRDLSDFERDAIWEIAEWSDKMGMHLILVIEPWMLVSGSVIIPGGTYWILGTSVLGSTTILGP